MAPNEAHRVAAGVHLAHVLKEQLICVADLAPLSWAPADFRSLRAPAKSQEKHAVKTHHGKRNMCIVLESGREQAPADRFIHPIRQGCVAKTSRGLVRSLSLYFHAV